MDDLTYFVFGTALPFAVSYLLPKQYSLPLSLFMSKLAETRAGMSNKKDEK